MQLVQRGEELAGKVYNDSGTSDAIIAGAVRGDRVQFEVDALEQAGNQINIVRYPLRRHGLRRRNRDHEGTGSRSGRFQRECRPGEAGDGIPTSRIASGDFATFAWTPSSVPPQPAERLAIGPRGGGGSRWRTHRTVRRASDSPRCPSRWHLADCREFPEITLDVQHESSAGVTARDGVQRHRTHAVTGSPSDRPEPTLGPPKLRSRASWHTSRRSKSNCTDSG